MSQNPPFAVQVELTEGCNLRCSFCGLNGIRGKDNNFKFMSIKTAKKVAFHLKENKWNSRVEFAMHGEPSVNPNMETILGVFRTALPKANMMMTSNGAGFLKDTTRVDRVLEYLNVLALDWYEGIAIVPKILERYSGKHAPIRYPENSKGNPHRRRKLREHDWVVIQDIAEATKGVHASLNNHAGAGAPKNTNAVGKRCAKPFREMSVRWNGNVAVCCNDWRGEYKCGNLLVSTLDEVWNGAAMQAARRKLYYGMRDFGPCNGCDALSYRVGLLPDQLGKGSLPSPTANDLEAIQSALDGNPYTLPVLREWEQ